MENKLVCLFILVGLASASAFGQTFEIDRTKSKVGFEAIKYPEPVSAHVKGTFTRINFGRFNFSMEDMTKSWIEADIDTCSFNTDNVGNSKAIRLEASSRDKDVTQSNSYLDCGHFPHMIFKSAQIFPDGDSPNKFKAVGQLTLKGITKPVVLAVEMKEAFIDPQTGQMHLKFAAVTQINRKDFGIDGLTAQVFKLRDALAVNLDIDGVVKE